MPASPHIVVVGAGYAGAHAARAALDRGADVTVIDDRGRHDFTPRLAAVAGGSSGIGDGWASVDALLDVRVVRGAVTAVDTNRHRIAVGPDVEAAYDALVLTVGADPVVPPVAGGDAALTLRTADDATAVRRAVETADELVVIGGGATGVQLAGEAAAAHPELTVRIVERERRLLPGFGMLLGLHAARVLRRRGVRLHLSSPVTAVDPEGVELEGGRRITGVPVWAAGFAASGNRLLPDAPTRDGRLVVDERLRVPNAGPVFAAGDIAAHRDVLGRPLRMSAQVARQAGRVAGHNAARAAEGHQDLSTARLVDWGWIIDLGDGSGVARIGPMPLAFPVLDRLVPLLHGAVDVRHLFEVGGLGAVWSHARGRHHPEADLPQPSPSSGVA